MPKTRPTRGELLAAAHKTVPDVLASNLKILFCGINPGLYTAAIGHHYGRPGNRFWPALHASGVTARLLDPSEERELLQLGYGLTNVVPRATASENELTTEEIMAGGRKLRAKIRRYSPRFLAVLGLGVYRTAFERPGAKVGLQDESLGDTRIWVLPSPSGLNAHYQIATLSRLFRELKEEASRIGE